MRIVPVTAALLALAACTASPEQVADFCEDRVGGSTTTIGGSFALGYASDRGFVSDSDLALTAGVNLPGRPDPVAAYERCVRDRSGQGPVRPLGVS